MKRFATFALAVLFVTSLAGAAIAERTGLSITGSMDFMARQDENQVPNGVLGNNGVDNRVEQKVNLNIDADLTDNVQMHLGLEASAGWGGDAVAGALNAQGAVLAIDEAYLEIKELFIEQLTVKAGVMTVEYSLRDDGNSMFLVLPEIGAWMATLDYDPLYVDLLVGKVAETRRTLGVTDTDIFLSRSSTISRTRARSRSCSPFRRTRTPISASPCMLRVLRTTSSTIWKYSPRSADRAVS
jgi:hypothetical protein